MTQAEIFKINISFRFISMDSLLKKIRKEIHRKMNLVHSTRIDAHHSKNKIEKNTLDSIEDEKKFTMICLCSTRNDPCLNSLSKTLEDFQRKWT